MKREHIRLLFAVLAVVFFATPVALRAMGVTADAFENRRFAEAPRLSQGWDLFDQTTRFLTDRMPLREEAVRANAEISETLFGTTPRYGQGGGDRALPFAGGEQTRDDAAPRKAAAGADSVVPGANGWLYLRDDLEAACSPAVAPVEALARWQRLVKLIRESGRRAVLVVAPDKTSIYPENLRVDRAVARCSRRGRARLGRALAAAPAGITGLRQPILDEKRRTGRLLYRRLDTHWNERGALALVRAALRAVGGGVRFQSRDVAPRQPLTINGDLTVLQGRPRKESAPGLSIRRPRAARRVPGRAVYVIDSFGNVVTHLVQPYFEEFREVLWTETRSTALANHIAASDTVVLEVVERSFAAFVSDSGPASPAFAQLLRRRLAAAGRP